MTDEKRYTEAEYRKGQRSAYICGVKDRSSSTSPPRIGADWETQASVYYPAPTITRPRTVKVQGVLMKIEDDYLHAYWHHKWVSDMPPMVIGLDGMKALAGLLANPTETVPLEDE